MPKVTIIIPVYKANETITACLNSVIAQTLDDLEIILVDDHGEDGSIDTARQLLQHYTGPIHFRFLETTSNSGPGVARNLGIQEATGEYVAFLDSDDILDPRFCEKLYCTALAWEADMVYGHISFDLPEGRSIIKRNPLVSDGPFVGAAKRKYLRQFTSYFTTYLYRRSLLNDYGIRFPNTHSAEDSCFLICALLSARSIAHVDEALYHYRILSSSVSQKKDPQRWKNRLSSFRAMRTFAQKHALYRSYNGIIRFLIFKKGWIMAAKDFFQSNLLFK